MSRLPAVGVRQAHPAQLESPYPRRRALVTLIATSGLGACAVVTDPVTDPDPSSRPTVGAPAAPSARPLLPPPALVPTSVGRLAVRDTGRQGPQGEVIVLWPSILADHRIYRRQIEAWRDRHRLIVIDGPGHGHSAAAPGPFTMAQCAQAMAQVLDALDIRQPVVVLGTSWGGLVAGEFAIAQPHRTRAVVMLNTPVYTTPDGPGFSDRFVVWGARWIHRTGVYRDGVAKAFFLPATRESGGLLLQDFHRHLQEADGAALALSVRAVLIEREALAPRMGRIAAPTLFVAGRHDAMYPMDDLREAAARLPRGRFEMLETGHISVVDAPDAVTALVDQFLQK